MKLTGIITRSLQADMQVELRNIERAVAVGARDAGRGLRTELRRQVTSAGPGQLLENAPRQGTDGRRISLSTFPEHRFRPLRFVPLTPWSTISQPLREATSHDALIWFWGSGCCGSTCSRKARRVGV
jgi:hypothetical protein